MSVHNQATSVAAHYMSRVKSIAPNVRVAKSLQTFRSKRHTLQDAQAAVATKLRENLSYLRDPESVDQPDLVYKLQGDGTYALGIKYGNRWLLNVFDGATYLCGLDTAAVCEMLEVFAEAALTGQLDAYIAPIMQANVKARSGA